MNVQISSCQYLFGKEAEAIFSNLKEMRVEEKRAYIEQCLELMMRVNVYILTHKNGFCLVDPMTYNNQCHLYSLRGAQIQVLYSNKTDEEKSAQTEENRFLHLSLFLSHTLASDTNLMVKMVRKAMKEMEQEAPKFARKTPLTYDPFETFLLDAGRCREKASRMALNEVFEKNIKETFEQPCEENKALYSDLSKLAQEDLRIASNRGKKEGILYTLPKFAGVAYLVDVIQRKQIPFVIKVKVITKDGSAGNIIVPSRDVKEGQPVIVFEGFATDGKSIEECRKAATKCPTYFYRDIKSCHKEDETCFYCKTTPEVDLNQNIKNIQLAVESFPEMLNALGADFVLNCQEEFEHHFKNKNKYPLLSELFEKAIPKIKELGLDMNQPKTFSVCHCHMDVGSVAISDKLQLDQTHELFLEARGLI